MDPVPESTSYFFWLCISIICISIACFYFYRRVHQLKVRLPGLSIALGVTDLLFIIVIHVHEMYGIGCVGVLWSGNIFANLVFMFSLMRLWCFYVFSDRAMRRKYQWTTHSKLLAKVSFSVLIYTIILTFLTQNFDSYYISMVEKDTCFFVLPVWDYIPSLIVYVSLRIFLAAKVRQTSSVKGDASKDYFGIYKEVKITNVVFAVLIIAYFGYTYHFVVGGAVPHSELSNASKILTANYFGSVIMTLLLPVLKVLFSRKKKRKIRRVNVTSQRSLSSSQEFDVKRIWYDAKLTNQFREHAQRSLCAENVDFCTEVLGYKIKAENLTEIGCPIHTKEKLHQIFVKINEEFVCDNSPSEINISCAQKSHILQYMHPEYFLALDTSSVGSIFDEAQAEIEKVLQSNLGSSFSVQYMSHPSEEPRNLCGVLSRKHINPTAT